MVEFRHVQKQDSKGSQISACVANSAAVTEQHKFLCYITHRLRPQIQRKHTALLSISLR